MNEETNEIGKLPFTGHLEELRKRLIVCFVAVGIGFVLSYGFKEQLFQILARPLITVMAADDKLIFTGLPEAFFYIPRRSLFYPALCCLHRSSFMNFGCLWRRVYIARKNTSFFRSSFSPHSSFWAAHFLVILLFSRSGSNSFWDLPLKPLSPFLQ